MKQDKRASFGESTFSEFPVVCEPSTWKYRIRLFGTIDDHAQLHSALYALEDAAEGDQVEVSLSSLGGSLDATDTLLQAMDECKGEVTVRASGTCASAASLILLSAPQFTLSDGFSCMIHCGSLGFGGTLSEVKTGAAFNTKHMEKILRNAYEGFMSQEEIDRMIDGKDFYMDAEEFVARFEKRNQIMMALHADVEA